MKRGILVTTSKDVAGVDRVEIAVKVVGATLNGDAKTLLAIIKKSTEDYVVFMALSGLFHLIARSNESISDLLDLEYGSSDYKALLELFQRLEGILEKNSYKSYPVAVLPNSKIKSSDFLHESLSGILKKYLYKIFSASLAGHYFKEDLFVGPDFINCIFRIVSTYKIIDSEKFFQDTVTTIACEALDDNYTRNLSNSKNKVWDSQRAARDYFLRKLLIFNPIIPSLSRNIINARWQAWFLLEDLYKSEEKRVDRKKLVSEMLQIYESIQPPAL